MVRVPVPKSEPVSPLPKVTLFWKITFPPFCTVMPELAPTVSSKVAAPLPESVIAAPVPVPMLLRLPLKSLAAVPALTVRFSAPVMVPSKVMAASALETLIAPVARVTGLLKSIVPVAGEAVLPTAPLRVIPPGAVKSMGPEMARPTAGRLKVWPVIVSPVRSVPIWSSPVTVPEPPSSELSVNAWAPVTGPPKLIVLPWEITVTGSSVRVRPALKVSPS